MKNLTQDDDGVLYRHATTKQHSVYPKIMIPLVFTEQGRAYLLWSPFDLIIPTAPEIFTSWSDYVKN